MSNRLPVEVNPFRLIEQRRQLSGVVHVSNMPRLCALLVPGADSGKFDVDLDFLHSPSHLPMINGQVTGQVILECQRCLEPVTVDVDTVINVVVTASQTDRRPEEEGYEICIVDDERLFLQDFIEDEILLALPAVARHEQCEPVRSVREIPDADNASDEQIAQEDKQNPFAVLKDWKKTE
ncbi:MAG: YceD family protein [Thiolinea sp.]